MYKPEVAFAGTAHEADSIQLPQSTRLMSSAPSKRQAGCICGNSAVGAMPAATRPRTVSIVVSYTIDINVVCVRMRIDLEMDGFALVDTDVGRVSLNTGIPRAIDIPFAGRIAR